MKETQNPKEKGQETWASASQNRASKWPIKTKGVQHRSSLVKHTSKPLPCATRQPPSGCEGQQYQYLRESGPLGPLTHCQGE